ncbi:MAG: tetratricopeptide repeat protein [Magnetococcales bacterium]|nr:tetratricopeptide repeat protein [Magnetococcales bacterium]
MQQNINDNTNICPSKKTPATKIYPHLLVATPSQQRGSAKVADHFLTNDTGETISVKKQTSNDTLTTDWDLPEFESVRSTKSQPSNSSALESVFGFFTNSSKPKTANDYRKQGIALSEQRRFTPAAKMLEKAIEMGASDLECQMHLGLTYTRMGRIDDAIALLSDLSISHGDDAGVATLLGKALLLNSQYSEAAEVMAPAAANNPSRFNLHFFLGLAQAKLNEFDLAIESWLKAIKLHPSHQMTRQFLNRALDAKAMGHA